MRKSVYENQEDLKDVIRELDKWDFISSTSIICAWIDILAMENNMDSNDLAQKICEMVRVVNDKEV